MYLSTNRQKGEPRIPLRIPPERCPVREICITMWRTIRMPALSKNHAKRFKVWNLAWIWILSVVARHDKRKGFMVDTVDRWKKHNKSFCTIYHYDSWSLWCSYYISLEFESMPVLQGRAVPLVRKICILCSLFCILWIFLFMCCVFW